jgi:hypothetical protein
VKAWGQGEADDGQDKASSCGASKIGSGRRGDVFWKQIRQAGTHTLTSRQAYHLSGLEVDTSNKGNA